VALERRDRRNRLRVDAVVYEALEADLAAGAVELLGRVRRCEVDDGQRGETRRRRVLHPLLLEALDVEATPVVKRAHVSSAGGDTAW
jgi:hypothetical protein